MRSRRVAANHIHCSSEYGSRQHKAKYQKQYKHQYGRKWYAKYPFCTDRSEDLIVDRLRLPITYQECDALTHRRYGQCRDERLKPE